MADLPDPSCTEADEAEDPRGQEFEQRSAVVQAKARGERLDRWLASVVTEFSRNHLQGLIEAGEVVVDGKVATSASRRVADGQQVSIRLVPPPQSAAFVPEPMALNIVFEDEHLLVVDKPVGLVVHPAPGHWKGTLLQGLLAHHRGAASLPRAGIVHRLDKDTSGLMLVGKTLEGVTALSRAIAAREVQRLYLALVHGTPKASTFTVDAPIGRDPISRVKMAVVPGGRAARTDVTVLASEQDISGIRCRLHTGRTHQIRVHLAHSGHPLVADGLYGGRAELGLSRQALHAQVLALDHPVSGQALRFVAELPTDLRSAWQQLFGAGAQASATLDAD